MDLLGAEALDRLAAALGSLLPAGGDPGLRPRVQILPRRIRPTGLGGLAGPHDDPQGEVLGRRVEAEALVTVPAADAGAALDDAVAAATRALVAAGRPTLLGLGILRLELDAIGPPPAADGPARREVRFSVLFEFLKPPEAAGDRIERIPIDLELDRGVPSRLVLDEVFGPGSLAQFEVVDDPAASLAAPSQWRFDAAGGGIAQRSRIRGGSDAADPEKPGTYLVLRAGPGRPPVRDFLLRTTLRSDAGGVGVVFRWQDVDNFYFFLMDARGRYRLLGKKVAGVFAPLDGPALDVTRGFEPGLLHDLKLSARGPAFRVELDGRRILAGRDASRPGPGPGRVGLLCRDDDGASFHRIHLVETAPDS